MMPLPPRLALFVTCGLVACGLVACGLAACGPATHAPTPPSPAAATPSHEPSAKASDAAAPCPAAPLPSTPLGERATALLDALGSGEASRIEALVNEQYAPWFKQAVPMEMHLEVLGGFAEETGGVTVCRVEYSSPTEALILLGANRGDGFHLLTVIVEEAAPHRLSKISLRPTSRDVLDDPPEPLDDAARHAVIEGVAGALDDYIFADVAATMQARIRSERDAGRYAEITHGMQLARRLTDDLRGVSHDEHLAIRYSPSIIPPETADDQPTAEELELLRAEAERDGFGIASVEVLEGNIGYVDVRLFHPVLAVEDGISEAMTKIADTKALIVDLRHNHGGDPATVAFMTSYLFGEKKVHLNDLYYRRNDQTTEYWTDPSVPGKRFGKDKPVFVLISDETFSGGEEFANNLRELKRATLIGEVTGGGAHPVAGVSVDEHFTAIVPVGRAINPITKTNWEGTGVKPHIEVPPSEALERAKELIAGKR